jgi:glutathione S-transferase
LVPVLLLPHPTKTGEVVAVNDSLAIFETISDLYSPDLAIWPRNKYHRALARSACAEFHSGFGALRGALPCNLRRVAKEPKEIVEAVKKDARRVCEIWEGCRKAFEDAGLRDGADVVGFLNLGRLCVSY